MVSPPRLAVHSRVFSPFKIVAHPPLRPLPRFGLKNVGRPIIPPRRFNAVCVLRCLLLCPRLRPGANGRDQPEQYQPLRVTLRSLDRRGWTFTDGIGGYCDIPRGSFFGGVLPERCGIGGASCGDDGTAAWNQLFAHVTAKNADFVPQG